MQKDEADRHLRLHEELVCLHEVYSQCMASYRSHAEYILRV
jgi:hypothetical protein